jgi:hypothetical protein
MVTSFQDKLALMIKPLGALPLLMLVSGVGLETTIQSKRYLRITFKGNKFLGNSKTLQK